jgi:thiamine biosynthesis lipoprotein
MKESIFLLDAYQALGTKWYLEVFEKIPEQDQERITVGIKNIIVSFEEKYSRFKPESLLNLLNIKRSIPHDKEFAEILLLADEAHKKSDAIFDIFIKDKLIEKGYGSGEVLHDEEKSTFVVNDTSIVLTGKKSLDFGGIGKGYLIDKLATYMKEEGLKDFLINGGGDMYVTEDHGMPIKLFLQHPLHPDEAIGYIEIKNKSFCNSSSYVRMWEKDGVKQNHFVTDKENEIWAASYVVGDTAVSADIAATILCIASNDEQKLSQYGKAFGVSYLVYDKDFKVQGNLMYTPLSI